MLLLLIKNNMTSQNKIINTTIGVAIITIYYLVLTWFESLFTGMSWISMLSPILIIIPFLIGILIIKKQKYIAIGMMTSWALFLTIAMIFGFFDK